MRSNIIAASLLALGLFTGVALAEDPVKATGEQSQGAEAALPPEVMAILSDTRPASELSQEELQARFAQARQFARMEGISPDIRQQLAAISKDARGELAARQQQQAQPAEQPAAKAEEPAQQQEQPGTEVEPAQQVKQRASGEGTSSTGGGSMPPAVLELIRDERPASSLDAKQLERRIARIRQFQTIDGLPPNVAARLAAMGQEAEQEWAQRQQAGSQDPGQQPGVQPPKPPVAEAPVQQQPPALTELLNDGRPASDLDAKQLERRIVRIRQFQTFEGLPPDVGARLAAMKLEAEQELSLRQQSQGQETAPPRPPKPPVAVVPEQQPGQPTPQAPAADGEDVQQLDANQVNPQMERRARDLLADDGAQRMSDEELRQRLDDMRQVLASNQLSRGMERELRRRVTSEREILRDRVAAVEADRLRREQKKQRPQNRYWSEEAPSDWDWSARDALNDRRRSEDLQTYELRRRIEIYRQATGDKRYAPEYREYWRAVIARDQYVLQLRLVDLRRKRQAQIDDVYDDSSLNFEIGIGRAPDEDVFAAEVDDEQLQDVLIAKPRRKFNRRFTIEEIEQIPEVRAAMPRVEVDTVRFGFNEAFVRPEEIDKLDRIGEILERILRKNPGEVFLIEGHTDAVGSDAANLALSRKRAEAVKKALTTYYIIPSRALRTAGYGERYLKIPTAEAEGENRRVSVGRATDVLGELQ